MHHWFKSYSQFAGAVDFAYWWSCIGKGQSLQPLQALQQACFLELYFTHLNQYCTALHCTGLDGVFVPQLPDALLPQ